MQLSVSPFCYPDWLIASGKIAWVRILSSLVLLLQYPTLSHAQRSPPVVILNQIPAEGFLLKEGWLFQAGDCTDGADVKLNDSQWQSFDPTKNIQDLPRFHHKGIGWLRIHLQTGNELPPLLIKVLQSVASEIYLDGELLYRFGTVSSDPQQVKAFNPMAVFSLPLRRSSRHILAVRIARQPGFYYTLTSPNWNTIALEYWLTSSAAQPALQAYDSRQLYLACFKTGISFILFVLHLSLLIVYPGQRANSYAVGMYFLSGLTFLARASSYAVHSMEGKVLIHYGSLLDAWVPAMALLTFYSLFNFRKGWLCWIAIASIGIVFVPLPPDYRWLAIPVSYYFQFELIRLAVTARKRKLPGSQIVLAGACVNLGMWLTGSAMAMLQLTAATHPWLVDSFYVVSFLCFPLTLSLWLALEHGRTNQQLKLRLVEIEALSARNSAQQQERQRLLSHQKERLEQLVAGRTQELHQQAAQLRQLDEVKSRFVTNITHEFRTPLTLILAPADALLSKWQNTEDAGLLTTIRKNAQQLLGLINQLLDLSKLDARLMQVEESPGRPLVLIREDIQHFLPLAETKQIRLWCSSDLDRVYWFDQPKFRRIITNLLANAIKFTSGNVGRPGLVEVSLREQEAGLLLTVTDTGTGIPPDRLPHIFDRFYQADDSSTRAEEGSGIGLSLVKELVDIQQGRITVDRLADSHEPWKTRFVLWLPCRPADDGDSSGVAEEVNLPFVLPVRDTTLKEETRLSLAEGAPVVLLVEDNTDLADFIVSSLPAHYLILRAANGQEGLDVAYKEMPDLIISDVLMPVMDGFAFCRRLKSDLRTSHIPVILLTARASAGDRLEGLEGGADDYLTKPFQLPELVLRIHNQLEQRRRVRDWVHSNMTNGGRSQTSVLSTDPFLEKVYQLISGRLGDSSLSADALAEELAVSRYTLNRKLKALTGLTTSDFIRSYRLKRAGEYLIEGCSSSETAYRVGFESPAYFTKCFRELYGMPPSEFVRQGGDK